MKYKGLYLLCFLILPILLLTSVSVYAVSNSVGEPTRSIEPKIEKYDLSNYRSIYDEESDWNPFGQEEISRQINNVADFFFSMTKTMASMTDYAIEQLFNLDVLDEFGDKIGNFVGTIYENLMSNLALMLFVIVCFNAFIIFSVQGNVREAVRRAFLIICLIGFGVGVLANAGSIIRTTNGIGKDLNNIIMNSTSSISGNVDYVNENSGLNNIRNQYFDMTVYRTYLVMNYGTVNEEEIKAKGKDRIDNILKESFSKKGEKNIDKIVENEVDEKKINNKYMTQGYVFQKLAISIIGFVITLFMSIVFLAISFAKLVFSTFSLFLFIFLAFSWIISFLPGLEISVFKAFAKTIGYMILSVCMTFLFVVVGLCIDLANTFIVPDSQNAYFLNSIFIIVILFVMFKKRSEIISFVTRGNVSFSATKIGASAVRKTQDSWNAMRFKESQNKCRKRERQRIAPESSTTIESDPKRNSQEEVVSIVNSKDNEKKRTQQSNSPSFRLNKEYASRAPQVLYYNPKNNDNDSSNIKRDNQQSNSPSVRLNREHVNRSPQVLYYNPKNNDGGSTNKKSEQTSYDNNIQKRQVLNKHDINSSNQQIIRSPQSKQRLDKQKEINKHGE